MPIVLGEDGRPAFASSDEAELTISLILRFYDQVGESLGDPGYVYEPGIGDEQGALNTGAAVLWAIGYLKGVSLRADAWEPLFYSEMSVAINPILELSKFVDPKSRKRLDSTRTRRDAEALADAAMDVYDFWLERRHTPARRASPKTGRNEPCPCGSGRKYKVCCGKI